MMFIENIALAHYIFIDSRILYGESYVREQLRKSRVEWDMWFTGAADFPGSALQQIAGAVKKR